MARRKPAPSIWPRCCRPGSWRCAPNASPLQTIKCYGDGVRAFLRWCETEGHSRALDRELVKGFVAALLESGAEPATARARR